MELFDSLQVKSLPGSPLAEKMRPDHFEDFIGQSLAVKELLRWAEQENFPNIVLFGPPGTGKTSFARLLSQKLKAHFMSLNAVESGSKQLKEIGDQARNRRRQFQERTIVFIDEIHRFNKSQQDVLLGFIETGDLVLIGATTENPSYELNRALLSRVRIIKFQKLTADDLTRILESAISRLKVSKEILFTPQAWTSFLTFIDGDARQALNTLEALVQNYQFDEGNGWPLSAEALQGHLQKIANSYGRQSSLHFDILSAFIKSMRGSDVDAALLYLAYMLENGEDPTLIGRRCLVFASEDVGNADPQALAVAINGFKAIEVCGMPEARICLAQMVTYLASAPKSNRSYLAFGKAQNILEKIQSIEVPEYLKNKPAFGSEQKYKYPHDFPRAWVDQDYWPKNLPRQVLYEPSDSGFEKKISDLHLWRKGKAPSQK